jgi:hypothetical protein
VAEGRESGGRQAPEEERASTMLYVPARGTRTVSSG